MAFLDGAPPERLCQPMVDYMTSRGGAIKMESRVKDIVLNEDGSIKNLKLVNGETVEGDLYISAVPGERAGGASGASGRSVHAWQQRHRSDAHKPATLLALPVAKRGMPSACMHACFGAECSRVVSSWV